MILCLLEPTVLQVILQNAIKDIGNFQQKMDSINGKSVDNVEKSTGSLSSKLAGLVSHVPILGNIVEKMTGVGNASNTAASAVGRVGENASSGFGAIQSGASNAKNSMEQLGSGVEGVKGKFSMLEGIATVALGNIASRAITAGASLLNKWTLAPMNENLTQLVSWLLPLVKNKKVPLHKQCVVWKLMQRLQNIIHNK